jgi:AcrR family transcriptional regulator
MSTQSPASQRRYRKRIRAEQERRTRERITEAAVRLHGTLGPARTTTSAVAEEAGVQRATVYRHFPDDASLFAACSAHYLAANPPPDLEAWSAIDDPGERVRSGLTELYAYYRRTEPMLERVSRDAPLVPAMAAPLGARLAYLDAAADVLVSGRPERGAGRRRAREAAGHAVAFSTWQSLVRDQGMPEEAAVALMAELVGSAGPASRAA